MKARVPAWVSILIVAIVFIIVGVGFWWYTRAENNFGNRPYVSSESPVPGDEDSSKKEPPSLGEDAGNVKINPIDGAEMVWVPAGEFMMGMGVDKKTAAIVKGLQGEALKTVKQLISEQNVKVYLDSYWIYKYEVTVAQYRKFCDATKRKMPEAPAWSWKDDHPMVNVTWQDAADYAKWAGARLPTEAQWEKAAKGTDRRVYPWGNKWDASKCANSEEQKLESTQPVGSYPAGASPYGAMDMAGNAWEWCADWYAGGYANPAVKNPTGPSHPDKLGGGRVIRGGSWRPEHMGDRFRCARRGWGDPSRRNDDQGFRCAMTP